MNEQWTFVDHSEHRVSDCRVARVALCKPQLQRLAECRVRLDPTDLRCWILTLAATILLAISPVAQAGLTSGPEYNALVSIYNSTNLANGGYSAGWLSGDACGWGGGEVFCDQDTNPNDNTSHIIGIELNNLHLTGSLPSLSALTHLQWFDVGNNQLTGSLPALAGLTNLVQFYAYQNRLTGPIPALAGLTNLQYFEVQENQLTGSIPALIGLNNLSTFYALANQLTGTIPALESLTNLIEFKVQLNQLTGPIPALAGMTNLATFDVGSNQLTGSIPALSGLTNLTYFVANSNLLSGSIPDLSGSPNLLFFFINDNRISGVVPAAPAGLYNSGAHAGLCPNSLDTTPQPSIDPIWNIATGSTPWYSDCKLKVTLTSPMLGLGVTVRAIATHSSPLTITVIAPSSDTATLSLTDASGTPLDSTYGTLSPTTLSALAAVGDGTYAQTATYTPPNIPPIDIQAYVGIAVKQGSFSGGRAVTLGGPPILLLHGLWDSAGDLDELSSQAMQTSVLGVAAINYGSGSPSCPGGDLSGYDFTSDAVQNCVGTQIAHTATSLRSLGISFSKFDAIGHSMGSLVAAYYQSTAGVKPENQQIGRLASIGTPWNGSPLADLLWERKDYSPAALSIGQPGSGFWMFTSAVFSQFNIVSLNDLFSLPYVHHHIGGAIESLSPSTTVGNSELAQARGIAAQILVGEVAGMAPATSGLENIENVALQIVDANIPIITVDSLLGGSQQHDLVVPLTSQKAVLSQISTRAATHLGWDAFFGKKAESATSGGVLDELHTPGIIGDALCSLGHKAQCNLPSTAVPVMLSGVGISDELTDLAAITLTGSQLAPSAVAISAIQPVTAFGNFMMTATGTETCIPQTTFVADFSGTIREWVGASPAFTLPVGSGSSSLTTWLVICSSGDFVATSIAIPVAAPTLVSIEVTPSAYIVQPGDTIIARVTASYEEGSMDVTGLAETSYSATGPQFYLGGGAYQALSYGMLFITGSFGGQSATIGIQVGTDELFQSGFE